MYRITSVGPQRGVGGPTIKSTPLLVNGILYFTIPDHIFAINARTGEQLWQYNFEDQGRPPGGPARRGHVRRLAVFHESRRLVHLAQRARTGKERWRKKVADEKLQYFTTMAPLVVKNHILVGVGGDAMDVRGYLESRDPETGELQWRWYTTPEKMGDPGSETWPNLDAMHHGGGMTWLPGTYDPDLNLLYWGTGNANPVFAGQSRKGSNLWTASIVALNPDTGKLAVVFPGFAARHARLGQRGNPGAVRCRDRRPAAQAAGAGSALRDGSSCWTGPTARTWFPSRSPGPATGRRAWTPKGQPIPDPAKEPKVDGSMIDMPAGGATNWPPPSYDPQTELFYVNGTEAYGMAYLLRHLRPSGRIWRAAAAGTIDTALGVVRHGHPHRGDPMETRARRRSGRGGLSGGVLTTAGKLLFTGDSGDLVAFDPANGKPLWHQRLPLPVSNGPSTYMLDGRQYIIAGAGDTIYALRLAGPPPAAAAKLP